MARSRARLRVSNPVVWVRYDTGVVRAFALDRLRLSDFVDSVPWRQGRARHGQAHYSGAYASATTGGLVVYESRLELARLLLADFDPQVHRIYAQPFRVVGRVGGRIRCHVPDLLLVTAAGTGRLVNVKPAARLEDPRVAEALAWPGMLAERHGWDYEVWSGADVTVVENIRFLASGRASQVLNQTGDSPRWSGQPVSADTRPRARPGDPDLPGENRLTVLASGLADSTFSPTFSSV